MSGQVTSDHHGDNESDLEGMLSKHQELKTEIDAMHKNFENLDNSGQSLLTKLHYAAEVIKERLEELRVGWGELSRSWEGRTMELQKRKKAENMNREVTQLEAWLLNREPELSLNDAGNCLESVEDLLKKHDEMERMLLAQEERFLGLMQAPNDEFNVDNDALESQEDDLIDTIHSPTSSGHNAIGITTKHPELNSHHDDRLGIGELSELNGGQDTVEISSKFPELNTMSSEKDGMIDTSSIANNFPASSKYKAIGTGKLPELNNYHNDTPGIRELSEFNDVHDTVEKSSILPDDGDEPVDAIKQDEQFLEPECTNSERSMDTYEEDTKLSEKATMIVEEMPTGVQSGGGKAKDAVMFFDIDGSEIGMDTEADELGWENSARFDGYHTATSTKDLVDQKFKRKSPMRQNTHSFFKEPMASSYRVLDVSPLYAGVLKRKQETDVSEQHSVAQPWRPYYTVLSEDELHFFKDLEGFKSRWHLSKPMRLAGAFCEQVKENSMQALKLYTSRYIFTVILRDKSEYFFATESEEENKCWVVKINSVIKMAVRYGSSHGVGRVSGGGDNGGGSHRDYVGLNDDGGGGSYGSNGQDSDNGIGGHIHRDDDGEISSTTKQRLLMVPTKTLTTRSDQV